MTKLTPKIRQRILEDLLQKEQQQESKLQSHGLIHKTKRQDTSFAPMPKKEFLRVTLVTMVCLAIILVALWIDLETDFLTEQAQKLTQALHI
jgi:type VI protein secretion system component VasF